MQVAVAMLEQGIILVENTELYRKQNLSVPGPPSIPPGQPGGGGGGGRECWPSTNPASLALNPYIPWLPTLLVAQLGTSHLQTKCLMSPEPVPPITGTILLLTAQR